MSKLPAVTARRAITAFAAFGFVEVRQSSSHHILKRPGHRFVLTVPDHGNKTLKPGTLRSLIRAAEITVDEFVNALEKT
jgi:predicted RNA binding protein YcfA (HicA-like mRNA interferase family)